VNVLFIGDSLMVGAEPLIQLNASRRAVDSRVGRNVGEGLREVVKFRGIPWDFVLVSLGTNDWYLNTPSWFDSQLMRMRTIVGPHPVIVWSTIHRPLADSTNGYTHWNAALRKRAKGSSGHFRVADWSHELAKEASPDKSLLSKDGVHPNKAGYAVLAKLFREAVLL